MPWHFCVLQAIPHRCTYLAIVEYLNLELKQPVYPEGTKAHEKSDVLSHSVDLLLYCLERRNHICQHRDLHIQSSPKKPSMMDGSLGSHDKIIASILLTTLGLKTYNMVEILNDKS